ncbi:hypothetical protein Tco_1137119 [Tanacetum coccineum]
MPVRLDTFTTTFDAFPSNIPTFSPATCRWGNISPAKCRWGKVDGMSSERIDRYPLAWIHLCSWNDSAFVSASLGVGVGHSEVDVFLPLIIRVYSSGLPRLIDPNHKLHVSGGLDPMLPLQGLHCWCYMIFQTEPELYPSI